MRLSGRDSLSHVVIITHFYEIVHYCWSTGVNKLGRYSANDGRMMPDYDRGSSYARRGEHYVRGHYSRSDGRDAYDDYMAQKQSYRSGKSEDCKRKMLAALEEHLDELTTEMSDMSKDAECREERDLVKRYVERLRDMI